MLSMDEKRNAVAALVTTEADGKSDEWIEGAYRALIAQAKRNGGDGAAGEQEGTEA